MRKNPHYRRAINLLNGIRPTLARRRSCYKKALAALGKDAADRDIRIVEAVED